MSLLFEKEDRILFIGDSIGDCQRGRPFGDTPAGWGDSYIGAAAGLLQATYPELHLKVCNVCTDGDQTRHLLKRWDLDVTSWHPHWVCMMIGINDVWRRYDTPDHPEDAVPLDEYQANLEQLLSRGVPDLKGFVLMTPFFLGQQTQDPMRGDMDRYREAACRIGQAHGCVVVDTQKAWDSYFAKSGCHPHAISWDCIHPNRVGRMVLCRAFLQAVGYEWNSFA